MQIELTAEEDDLIRHAIETGRIGSPEAAIREALAFWMERERRREELLAAIDEADASLARGEGVILTEQSVRNFVEDINNRGRARHAAERNKQR